MDQYELIPNLTTVVKFLHRLLSIEMPEQLSNSQTPPHTPVKSFQWPKVPQCIYYKLYLLPTTPFKHLNPLTFDSYSPFSHPILFAHHHIYLHLSFQLTFTLSEILQPRLSPYCTNSLERTLKRLQPIGSFFYFAS